ncbi:hypothetical protein RFI_34519, partial [Reticulomyxa filosa]
MIEYTFVHLHLQFVAIYQTSTLFYVQCCYFQCISLHDISIAFLCVYVQYTLTQFKYIDVHLIVQKDITTCFCSFFFSSFSFSSNYVLMAIICIIVCLQRNVTFVFHFLWIEVTKLIINKFDQFQWDIIFGGFNIRFAIFFDFFCINSFINYIVDFGQCFVTCP